MSIRSLCTGDTITLYTVTEGGWSTSVSMTKGKTIDCRIDTFGSDTDASGGRNDESSRHTAYFSSNPEIAIGHYAKWTHSGGVKLSIPRWLKATGAYPEGRPGKTLLWIVDFEKATADDVAGVE